MLGLRVGGGRGRGVNRGKGDFKELEWECPPLLELEFVTGMKVCGWKVGICIEGGDAGGDGVVDVDRNVGPRGVSSDSGESHRRFGTVRSNGWDIGRVI